MANRNGALTVRLTAAILFVCGLPAVVFINTIFNEYPPFIAIISLFSGLACIATAIGLIRFQKWSRRAALAILGFFAACSIIVILFTFDVIAKAKDTNHAMSILLPQCISIAVMLAVCCWLGMLLRKPHIKSLFS